MVKSKKGIKFAAEEDMKIWRFAIEKIQKHGEVAWKELRNRTGSTRSEKVLRTRFRTFLLPHLPVTQFHTETKLKLCMHYKFPVGAEFLQALREDANVKLDSEGIVAAYTMKPTVRSNTDMELDDEEFLELTCPILHIQIKYTKEEDTQIWNYFIKHHRRYTRGSAVFWEDLIREKKWNRTTSSVLPRFSKILAPQLHKTDFDVKTKLELYKSCKISVDPKYLKTLKEQYDLEVDEDGCIVEYEKIDDDKFRSSSDKKLEQPKSSITVKTEDISEPVAKRQRYEKEFYIDSESDLDETDSESRFGDIGDVENQNSIQNISRDSDEDHPEDQTVWEALPDDEPQRPMSQRRDRETRSMAKSQNVEQKVVITKNTEKKTKKRARNMEESRSCNAPVVREIQLQELENRIVEKLTTVVQNAMITVSEDLIYAKITKLSKNLEESLRTEISKVSRSVGTLTKEVRDVSQKIQSSLCENGEKTSRKKKEFLLNLKNLISPLHARELEDVVQRIDEAVQSSPEEDVDPNQMRMIRSSLDMLLLAIGH